MDHVMRVRFSPVTPVFSGVRFHHSRPQRVRLVAGQSALNAPATVRFSHPLPFCACRPKDRAVGYEPTDRGSSPRRHTRYSSRRSRDRARASEARDRRSSRRGKATDRWQRGMQLIVYQSQCGFESRPVRQFWFYGDIRQWQAQRLSIAEPRFDSGYPCQSYRVRNIEGDVRGSYPRKQASSSCGPTSIPG